MNHQVSTVASGFFSKLLDVSTEMALHVLVYNMKQALGILGVASLIEAIRA